eukprot:569586-Hanusia_phi.AAC.1
MPPSPIQAFGSGVGLSRSTAMPGAAARDAYGGTPGTVPAARPDPIMAAASPPRRPGSWQCGAAA